jgi:deoxyribonuclease V
LVATDVAYDERAGRAVAAAVVFARWSDEEAVAEYSATVNQLDEYLPGQLYRRELPALLAVLAEIREPIEAVVVDGYVRLGAKPGLGAHLWEATCRRFAVIGVAKSPFRGAGGVEMYRGTSRRPLYLTSIGIDEETAAKRVEIMSGSDRIPVLLWRADRLAREGISRF